MVLDESIGETNKQTNKQQQQSIVNHHYQIYKKENEIIRKTIGGLFRLCNDK